MPGAIGVGRRPGARGRNRRAAALLAELFKDAGWDVDLECVDGDVCSGFLLQRQGVAYAVDLKVGSEGRPDRLVPLLAQAVLEAARAARPGALRLAVVAAPRIAPSAAEQILRYADDYAPEVAVGVIDFEGLRMFKGPHLETLNAPLPHRRALGPLSRPAPGHLFSDLNQWMLKVLLAPELPETLLSAPRAEYGNASELARAADVSVMTAYRFVQLLRKEGYLHESAPHLSLVRREDLFRRWQASAQRSVQEVPMRFVLRGVVSAQIEEVLGTDRACLALFAAAHALKLGLVEGVPPYVYVERLPGTNRSPWKELRPCRSGEVPDVILRKAPAPHSVFRGAVPGEGIAVSDVLQAWVDVASHPARGREQANLIRERVLRPVIESGS